MVVVALAGYYFSWRLNFSTSQYGIVQSIKLSYVCHCWRLDGSTNRGILEATNKSCKLSAVAAFPCGCKNLTLGRIIPERIYAAQSPGVKNIFFNWSKLQQLEVDTSPTRQQRKAPLYSLSQFFPVRRLARFDNKSKISIPGEFILHKVVEISPKAPFLHKRSRVGPRVRTSTDFERELAEDRRCDGRKHSKE